MTPRTRWHKMREVLDTENVYTLAPKDGTAMWYLDAGIDLGRLREVMNSSEDAPKFVVDHDLLQLAHKDEFHRSLLDMKKAGVLELPFPLMWVEVVGGVGMQNYPGNQVSTFSLLETGKRYMQLTPPVECDIAGYSLTLHGDEDGDYLAVSNSVSMIGIHADPDVQAMLRFGGHEADWSNSRKAGKPDLVEKTYLKNAMSVSSCWFVIMLLMQTKGVVQEKIDVPKLNKQRIKAGKHVIPVHTYIRIGHVYQKDGSTREYDERKSPRPHWRRGHIRNVRVGPRDEGKTQPVYVRPMLVAYHPELGGPEPRQPEYVVKE